MADLSWVGVWLLVIAFVVIVIEGVLAALWTLRIAKRSRLLNDRLAAEQAQMQAESARLKAEVAEMQVLWQPYRRLLRLLRHPIALAVLQSYARRRAAR
jgi:K+-sensing histidine kinase KdpD